MHTRPPLDSTTFANDPMTQFAAWFADARAVNQPEPEACALATVAADGSPSLRMVLLRAFDASGFVFYTNYESRKGEELATRPRAAMTFYWRVADRQVRVEGRVQRVSSAESDAYFAVRPRDSRISAIASPQSREIEDRATLEARVRATERAHASGDVPRPAHWGGFRLTPVRVEFWQARPHRLHDRLVYVRASGAWSLRRLAP
jgi:pyridoxamine 5'-phosphate oxidase